MNLSYLSKKQTEAYKESMNLSSDEEEVFDMLAKNCSITKIANTLKMSTRTVDRRIKSIKAKIENICLQ